MASWDSEAQGLILTLLLKGHPASGQLLHLLRAAGRVAHRLCFQGCSQGLVVLPGMLR